MRVEDHVEPVDRLELPVDFAIAGGVCIQEFAAGKPPVRSVKIVLIPNGRRCTPPASALPSLVATGGPDE
jgi:hypothetical protein